VEPLDYAAGASAEIVVAVPPDDAPPPRDGECLPR
jgi:hypothetical protein